MPTDTMSIDYVILNSGGISRIDEQMDWLQW